MANLQKDETGQWFCLQCNFASRKVSHVKTHIESKHVQTGGFICSLCSKVRATRESLRKHIARLHWNICRSLNSTIFFVGSDELIEQNMQKDEFGIWGYMQCEFTSNKTNNLRNHIEAKHIQSAGCCQLNTPCNEDAYAQKARKEWNWTIIFSPEWCHKGEDLQGWRWFVYMLWVWLLFQVQDNLPGPHREPPYFYVRLHVSLLPKVLPN